MSKLSGHWYPVLSSRELGKRPVGRMRFGQDLVFWRDKQGQVVCMPDRCPHRGAALSLGSVSANAIACPFHGIAFAADGTCARIPVEEARRAPDDFCVAVLPTHEANGFVWLWRGATAPPAQPDVPAHPGLEGMRYGESLSIWNAHFTRCIENVCDYSHLPFVHKTTIGLFKRNTVTQIEIEDVPGGFRAHLLKKGQRKQCLEFLWPNMWMLRVSGSMQMSAVFAPIDDHTTQVYGRTWYKLPLPGMRMFMDAYTRLSQLMVFREDWPIVASQTPWDVADATAEKLLPSDAPVIAYRKLLHEFATNERGFGPG